MCLYIESWRQDSNGGYTFLVFPLTSRPAGLLIHRLRRLNA